MVSSTLQMEIAVASEKYNKQLSERLRERHTKQINVVKADHAFRSKLLVILLENVFSGHWETQPNALRPATTAN